MDDLEEEFHHHEDHGGAHHEEEEEEGEPWLVSYADMMTLLFGFFVLLYSFARAEIKDDMVSVRKELASYFGGEVVSPFEEVEEKLEQSLAGTGVMENVEIKVSPEGMDITFRSTVLFHSGKADLRPKAVQAIQALIGLIKEEKGFHYGARVLGHTDDNPIRGSQKFDTNWELSGARASSVVRMFEANGFPAQDLVAVGYGASRPVAPNRNERGVAIRENQEQNRRVVVQVYITNVKQQTPSKTGKSPVAH